MHNMAIRLTDYLILNKITTEEMREEYIYGLEVFFGKILNYGTLILLALINKNLIPNILFMVSFFSLRGRTGGYHSKSPLNCYFGSIIIYTSITKFIVLVVLNNNYMLIVIMSVSATIIFLLAPINHPNLVLNKEEIKVCKSSSRWLVILIIMCAASAIWLGINPVYIAYVVIGMGMDAGLLIIAKILKQEVKNEETEKGSIASSG